MMWGEKMSEVEWEEVREQSREKDEDKDTVMDDSCLHVT